MRVVAADRPRRRQFVLAEREPFGVHCLLARRDRCERLWLDQRSGRHVTVTGLGIPPSERAALIALYNSTNGPGWTNNTNWLGAPGTECTWSGVTCGASGTTVTQLILSSRNLTGTLPPELGQLTNLQFLRFGLNHLSGGLPPELGSLANLVVLDLQLNQQLTGPMPPELASLTRLQTLIVDYNQLSGSIPAWLSNLPSLKVLSLLANRFTGSIPPELGNSQTLRS